MLSMAFGSTLNGDSAVVMKASQATLTHPEKAFVVRNGMLPASSFCFCFCMSAGEPRLRRATWTGTPAKARPQTLPQALPARTQAKSCSEAAAKAFDISFFAGSFSVSQTFIYSPNM